jgi:poly-gamma-glutamate capsule biosynthesis protein CapA/YwtB (metallophosphatase superfamily)
MDAVTDVARERILDAAVPLLARTAPTDVELRVACTLLGAAPASVRDRLRRVAGRPAHERRAVLAAVYDAAAEAPRVFPPLPPSRHLVDRIRRLFA